MIFDSFMTPLIRVQHHDKDVQRRGALLIVICMSFLCMCVLSAPLVLLRGAGSLVLGGLVLATTSAVVTAGLVLARRGKVNQAGVITALGLTTMVHLSVIASQGINIFLYFATLTPLVISQISDRRYVWPNVLLNLTLLGIIIWQVPNFAGGTQIPLNFVPVLVLMHLCTGLLSYSVTHTNSHFFESLITIQSDLRDAEHRAVAANKAKSTFLANMSHELRTPLNAIIGYAEILIDESEDQDFSLEHVRHDIERITTSGRHLLVLVNSVLDLAKVEAGRMQADVTHFEAITLIDELYATSSPLIKAQNNTLKVRLPQELDTIQTDRLKLYQILLNLLSNAAKFTKNGQVTLSVTARVDGRWDWSVKDEGIGIEDEMQGKIFEDFVQASTTTTREYGGTGLGLSLCVELSKLIKGDLSVESTYGEGSTFTLTIPHTLS